ncbi:putative mitochondrial hypothetical protein [Leptomonas pyrrhocoris]|uniref:4a-hydroxytetrahydrobiopterin dehydratase n=1 Tax=Leptomonas pyrrhocoris TaxID=157538 RepID=A0A0M9FTU9_LEPPY|nr:putative mitochondrial hypothetical protein [Leptomonas pyrrhocoris]XP_015654353.1 putative mitochondrial hypothetical protein [Leptomonas pyrrhocoris]KPA75913.1 putative mitochondrial hypothetical protein [Leptomonas pyrrhocoris]KPA75914.1 putative mitochondrial hypothetical protein [Leptomonas pyrrhocoris]|eukprot:XP_015654352.1 putative mitochondrial hypothetical protein [Leptomonas pyrrhocoris]
MPIPAASSRVSMGASHRVRPSVLPALRRFAAAAPPRTVSAVTPFVAPALSLQRSCKGDYGFNVFHNSNPQHGGSYARHERRMRDDEVEDFLKSVKHWTPVYDSLAESDRLDGSPVHTDGVEAAAEENQSEDAAASPSPSLHMGEEAITRTFTFETFRDAYLFMGRVWAFCYGSDKYPHVTWAGTSITVYLYSPSFRGLSKREARVAAFLNDQYNMARKSKQQQRRIIDGVVQTAAVGEMVGEEVAQALARRHARRTAPLREVVEGPAKWRALMAREPPVGKATEDEFPVQPAGRHRHDGDA